MSEKIEAPRPKEFIIIYEDKTYVKLRRDEIMGGVHTQREFAPSVLIALTTIGMQFIGSGKKRSPLKNLLNELMPGGREV